MPDVLHGIRVLDFTNRLFGPCCTQTLGDFGAEIIKVEPLEGEPTRQPRRGQVNGVNTDFLARNRNKKSICIDLRQEKGKLIALTLAAGADVLIHNFRPGVAERLRLDYPALSRTNPRLIYAMGSGYGSNGPYQYKGGQDRAAQAISGAMMLTGEPGGPPVAMGPVIIDFIAGMLLTQGILLAILARQRTGKGQRVDVSLLDSAIAANIDPITEALNTGTNRDWVRRMNPLHGIFRTQDSYLQLVSGFVRGGNPLPLVCAVLEIDDLSQDARFDTKDKLVQNGAELRTVLQQAFLKRPTSEWVRRMDEKDLICVPVNSYPDVFSDPQVQHNNLVMEIQHPLAGMVKLLAPPVKLSDTPGWVHLPPPLLGEHTTSVLQSIGYTSDNISELYRQGVVAGS